MSAKVKRPAILDKPVPSHMTPKQWAKWPTLNNQEVKEYYESFYKKKQGR